MQTQLAERNYTEALSALAALRDAVDTFFNDVMVNAEDPALRKQPPGPARRAASADELRRGHFEARRLMRHTMPTSANKKLVILDRDGVINVDSDAFIKSPDEWVAIPGSLEAIARLNQAGYRVAIASNQSGIGRGLFDMAALNAMHQKMNRAAAAVGGRIDAVFFCPHTARRQCECRKPKPGMLKKIVERFEIDPEDTPMVGDSLRDLQAGAALGFAPHLVLTGKGEKTLAAGDLPPKVRRCTTTCAPSRSTSSPTITTDARPSPRPLNPMELTTPMRFIRSLLLLVYFVVLHGAVRDRVLHRVPVHARRKALLDGRRLVQVDASS